MRRKKRLRKKAKKDTLSYWKDEFWKVFSKYIRTRDENRCFTCDKQGQGKGMHAGHFVPRATGGLALYFDERNVHAQCFFCNINLGGNGAEYYRRMVIRYGQETVDDIFRLRDTGYKKYTIEEYKGLIDEYKLLTEELNV